MFRWLFSSGESFWKHLHRHTPESASMFFQTHQVHHRGSQGSISWLGTEKRLTSGVCLHDLRHPPNSGMRICSLSSPCLLGLCIRDCQGLCNCHSCGWGLFSTSQLVNGKAGLGWFSCKERGEDQGFLLSLTVKLFLHFWFFFFLIGASLSALPLNYIYVARIIKSQK